MKGAILFDSTKCIGCEACAAACKEKNNLPAAIDPKLTAYTWTVVEQRDKAFVRRMCMHCESPTCASVCPVGAFQKCIMCPDRIANGQAPACASVCPTGATTFGDRDQLIGEARARLAAAPKNYVPRIYGLEEVGGTSVLILSGVPFASLGLRTDLPPAPLPMLTWRVLSKIPDFVIVGGAFLYGIWWITNRRSKVQALLAQEAAKPS